MFGYSKSDRELDEALEKIRLDGVKMRIKVECVDRAIASNTCSSFYELIEAAKLIHDYITGTDAPDNG